MPPKARFTRDKIEDAAYVLAKEKGIEAVAAREVAKSMGMTVTPIFTYFSGMEELKNCILERAKREFMEYLRGSLDYTPAFKEFSLRWMRFVRENPNLFRMLMQSEDGPVSINEMMEAFSEIVEPITDEIADSFQISEEAAKGLLTHMVVYINGLTGFMLQGDSTMCENQISLAVSQVCVSLVVRARVMEDSISGAEVRELLFSTGTAPKKKHHLEK